MPSPHNQRQVALAIFVTATALAVACVEPALAEFRIQEAGIEKGQVEFETRRLSLGVPEARSSLSTERKS
jgi:hypothetical protein